MRNQPAPERRPRTEPREIVELKRLRETQPDLAEAADLQIALVALQRRVQGRVPIPWVEVNEAWLSRQQQAGQPLLRFEELPLDWTDVRLMLREATGLLQRHGSADESDVEQVTALCRSDTGLQEVVACWYNAAALRQDRPASNPDLLRVAESLSPVLLIALRPFLGRCAETLLPRISLAAWSRGYCPLCGGEPEMAEITPGADRLLICSRCGGRWPHHPYACPFCANADRTRITSFASRDGQYRLFACDACLRYLKAYDGRTGQRPALVPVDMVATLPLDAAAIQKGYQG